MIQPEIIQFICYSVEVPYQLTIYRDGEPLSELIHQFIRLPQHQTVKGWKVAKAQTVFKGLQGVEYTRASMSIFLINQSLDRFQGGSVYTLASDKLNNLIAVCDDFGLDSESVTTGQSIQQPQVLMSAEERRAFAELSLQADKVSASTRRSRRFRKGALS